MMIMMMMVMMIMINCFLSEDLNQNGQKHSKTFWLTELSHFVGLALKELNVISSWGHC